MATINLDSGENVTCTFTNSENGEIEIRKDAQPDSGQDFVFTDNIPGCDIGTLDDDSNNTLDNDTTARTSLRATTRSRRTTRRAQGGR